MNFLIFLNSCSTSPNLSKNSIKSGELILKNGVFADKSWHDSLIFKRISWYHELTMQFDVMIADVLPTSGFYNWFSSLELDDVKQCQHFKILAVYSQDTTLYPYSAINESLESSGLKKLELIHFKKHLIGHPDAEMNSLNHYNIYGLCQLGSDLKSLILKFPGHQDATIY